MLYHVALPSYFTTVGYATHSCLEGLYHQIEYFEFFEMLKTSDLINFPTGCLKETLSGPNVKHSETIPAFLYLSNLYSWLQVFRNIN